MKKDIWRQASPKDQMNVILWAIEGELDNMRDAHHPDCDASLPPIPLGRGHKRPCDISCAFSQRALSRATKLLNDARELVAEFMPTSSWDTTYNNSGVDEEELFLPGDPTAKRETDRIFSKVFPRAIEKWWQGSSEPVRCYEEPDPFPARDGLTEFIGQVD